MLPCPGCPRGLWVGPPVLPTSGRAPPRGLPVAPGGTVLGFRGPGQPSTQLSCWASQVPALLSARLEPMPTLTVSPHSPGGTAGSRKHARHLGRPRSPPGASPPPRLPHPTAVEGCVPQLCSHTSFSGLVACGPASPLLSGGGGIERLQSSALARRVHSTSGGPAATRSQRLSP